MASDLGRDAKDKATMEAIGRVVERYAMLIILGQVYTISFMNPRIRNLDTRKNNLSFVVAHMSDRQLINALFALIENNSDRQTLLKAKRFKKRMLDVLDKRNAFLHSSYDPKNDHRVKLPRNIRVSGISTNTLKDLESFVGEIQKLILDLRSFMKNAFGFGF